MIMINPDDSDDASECSLQSEISFSKEMFLKLKSKDVISEDWFRLFLKMGIRSQTKKPEANTLPAYLHSVDFSQSPKSFQLISAFQTNGASW